MRTRGGEDWAMYGGNVVFRNTGKTPAASVWTDYYITVDNELTNRMNEAWFKRELGGYARVVFVPPMAEEREPGRRAMSPAANYYYFEAVTTYQGLAGDRTYWTWLRRVFLVREDGRLIEVETIGDWDRNRNFTPPGIANREEIRSLFETVKRTREQAS